MDRVIAFAKHYITFPVTSSKQRRPNVVLEPSGLLSIGLDGMLNVLSFIDGESMYELSCTNHLLESSVAHPYNWEDCTFDFRSMACHHVFLTIRKFGHLINIIHIRGILSPCALHSLCKVIAQYCKRLKFVDSFGVPYLFPFHNDTSAFSVTFPSCSSDHLTVRDTKESYLMYSRNDSIVQCMDIHGQSFDHYRMSIWQFEIDNHLREGFSMTFNCIINNCIVGTFSISDHTKAKTYAINMLYPININTISFNRRNLTLIVRNETQLPFGAGYARVSSMGRVSFISKTDDLKYIDSTIPPFALE